MTPRAHFWLRVAGLTLIFAAEFGPRLWIATASPVRVPVATATVISAR